ncbi:MAG: D-2-hydroxyacid dehydrogenase [Roseovarius sp.]|uniref:D-2-hydroxyacid dehydrogenase n=1 Tax=Roseovarius sp. TaxID=1486281 RepID=UPI0032EC9927
MSRDAPRVIIMNDAAGPMAARLREAVPEAEVAELTRYEETAALLAEFRPDVVYSIKFAGNEGFPVEALFGPDGPEWVSVGGSGCDHLGTWDAGRVTVTNSAGVAAHMMAEYAFGCALHFSLDIPGLAKDKAARRWDSARMMAPLKGRTLVIVGLGQTGQAVAARGQAFGMHVIGTRARPEPMENLDEVHAADALPELWGRADMIVVAVPLLPSTRGMIGAADFAAMKCSAVVVDVSRGGVIDSGALLAALQEGRIAGAGLDVFAEEPLPEESPFWDLDNIILSPHASGVYEGWDLNSFDMFIENLKRWQRGEALSNVVEPARGY